MTDPAKPSPTPELQAIELLRRIIEQLRTENDQLRNQLENTCAPLHFPFP